MISERFLLPIEYLDYLLTIVKFNQKLISRSPVEPVFKSPLIHCTEKSARSTIKFQQRIATHDHLSSLGCKLYLQIETLPGENEKTAG
ncbi:MAG: hypothetical protein AAF652_02680 [Cyanobacteria bacterium P01_C01_bin.72]